MQAPEAHDRRLQQRPSTCAGQEEHRRGLQDTPIQNLPHRLWLLTNELDPNHQPTNSLGIVEAERADSSLDRSTLS